MSSQSLNELDEIKNMLKILQERLTSLEEKLKLETFNYIEPTGYNLFLYVDSHSVEKNSKKDYDIGVEKKMVGDGKLIRKNNSATFCRFKDNNVSKIAFVGYIESINNSQPWFEKGNGGKIWKNYNVYNRGNMSKIRTIKEFCNDYKIPESEISGYNLCGVIGDKHKNISNKKI